MLGFFPKDAKGLKASVLLMVVDGPAPTPAHPDAAGGRPRWQARISERVGLWIGSSCGKEVAGIIGVSHGLRQSGCSSSPETVERSSICPSLTACGGLESTPGISRTPSGVQGQRQR